MVGITAIGSYIPEYKESNISKAAKFETTEEFIINKIGITHTARKKDQTTSDLCIKAFSDLQSKTDIDVSKVECIILCTQNGDYALPHTSAIIHDRIGAPKECAVFDISLGCSGYVYGLNIAKSFMENNAFKCGLLFTCDPYSDVIDKNDKNTELIFGDAATVTLLTNDYTMAINKTSYLSDGSQHKALTASGKSSLSMDGRAVFNFVLRNAPNNIQKCLEENNISLEDIDRFVLHQGSKFILDALIKAMKLPTDRVPFACAEYGNTVSSSIPLILKDYVSSEDRTILISGFGVGLGSATTLLTRKDHE